MKEAFIRDLRFALRSLNGTRRLSLAAAGCVAVGTSALMFILTIANAVLLKAPPFPDADRLVRLWTRPAAGGANNDVSFLDAADVAARAHSFESLEFATRTRLAVLVSGGTERLRGESVSPGYFDMIATQPAIGRPFLKAEYAAGAGHNIIISHSLWMRSFGGRTSAVGESVRARANDGGGGEELFTIIGVMPAGFAGTVDTDVSDFWIPVEQYLPRRILERRSSRSTWVLAKLRSGISLAVAQQEIGRIGRQLATEYPNDYRDITLSIESVGETWRLRFRSGLTMLTSAAFLLLIIACVNVSQIMMARAVRRQGDVRVRLALGASPFTIARQLILESSVVAITGMVVGAFGALAAVRLFESAGVFQLPSYVHFETDFNTIGAAGLIFLVVAILSSVAPMWWATRSDALPARESTRNMTSGRQQRRNVNLLVSLQVALSFLLLFGSALMLRTYTNLLNANTGYATRGVLRMAISLDSRKFATPESYLAFARDAKREMLTQPGVRAVSFIAGVLPPWIDPTIALSVNGEARRELDAVTAHAVDEDFFRVLNIPVVSGRAIGVQDQPQTLRVAVISRSLARAMFPEGEDAAIGKTIEAQRSRSMTEQRPVPLTIVGIAGDVQYQGPLKPRTAEYDVYVPLTQGPDATLSVAIATTNDPATLQPAMQRTLSALAPSSPLHWISTMEAELALQYGDARLYAWLTAVFGGAALLLVAMGVYGVLSNAVAQRFSELGLRMAVGATPSQILHLVVGEAFRPLAFGLLGGVAIAVVAAPFARSLVYGMAPTNPVTMVAVALGILTLGTLASLLPARRATNIDPLIALRG